jgi:CMD domain protein
MSAATPLPLDTVDALAAIEPGSLLARLRNQRPDVRQALQGSDDALLHPADLAGLSHTEREAAALRVAVLNKAVPLYARHRAALQQLGVDEIKLRQIEAPAPVVGPRLAAVLAHTDLLTLRPREATPAHLQALRAQGLTERNIVSLSQLIAYVNFQVRLLAGLQLLQAHPVAEGTPASNDGAARP